MITLSATLQAELLKRVIRVSPLIKFDFLSGAQRYWLGKGNLVTGGFTWQGVPVLVEIDFGRASINGSAENFSLRVSGVSATFLSMVSGAQTEFIGRAIEIWLQFFDDAWQPLDPPFQVRGGRMLGATYTATLENRSVMLKCESKFTARGLPPLGYLSPNDMDARYPGNTSLNEMPTLQNKTAEWPYFPPAAMTHAQLLANTPAAPPPSRSTGAATIAPTSSAAGSLVVAGSTVMGSPREPNGPA